MTKQEADALKSYVDFLEAQTANFENQKTLLQKPAGFKTETPNHAADALEYVVPTWHFKKTKYPSGGVIKSLLSLDEFKKLTHYFSPIKIHDQGATRDEILSAAHDLGYTLMSDKGGDPHTTVYTFELFTPKKSDAELQKIYHKSAIEHFGEVIGSEIKITGPTVTDSGVEFHAEASKPDGVSMRELLAMFVNSKDRLTLSVNQIEEFGKLVRVLTIEETTKGIGAHIADTDGNLFSSTKYLAHTHVNTRPNENIINLPKDFTL